MTGSASHAHVSSSMLKKKKVKPSQLKSIHTSHQEDPNKFKWHFTSTWLLKWTYRLTFGLGFFFIFLFAANQSLAFLYRNYNILSFYKHKTK
jgi:hypothetical protein